jgi:hypothetical protein
MTLIVIISNFAKDLEAFEKLAQDAFQRADRDNSGCVSYEEFVSWARANRDIMNVMESLNKVAADAKANIADEDSADEADEIEFSDVDDHNEIFNFQSGGYSANSNSSIDAITEILSLSHENKPIDDSEMKWKAALNEPTSFRMTKKINDGPDTNLELQWAHGYYAKGKANVRYVLSEKSSEQSKVVYTTAALAIVYNLKTREQTFYQVRALITTTKMTMNNVMVISFFSLYYSM